ncbi:MAG TPA: rhomboid family intramembrane serine protease [Bacteroidales bacterium]|nr:rhomboid family intramembrane serine protease [Bacteroidales bacterium]HRZ20510.1 rhomboid family intramembrane serine protease [Bacteroidales bacterium]
MNVERQNLIRSSIVPFLFILLLWMIKGAELIFQFDPGFLGIYPRRPEGLPGILLSPLIHGDVKHLAANTIPLLVLGTAIFHFYREIAWKVIILLYLVPGIWVWFGARDAYHIGASGLIYGLASFLFFSGLIRRDGKLMALSLLIVFLYGSMVWGIFPNFIPEKRISWESHLMGLIAGLILAIYFRKLGPQRKIYEWELEEDEDVDEPGHDEGNADDRTDGTQPPGSRIRYTFKE